MSEPIILVEPYLAQAPAAPKPASQKPSSEMIWMGASGILLLILIGVAVFYNLKVQNIIKQLKLEEFRNRELQKKYKLAVATIGKMEKNPDLIYSREFNLDYLRLRMSEDVFHYAIIVQIKMKVKQQIALALRPTQVAVGEESNAGAGRQIDSTFDVEYEVGDAGNISKKGVLFRIQIRLMKLPTQSTSTTINEIIDCLETYLSPTEDNDNWQPTIQGRIVHIEWDQKAKPTPMLVLEQLNEGVNVTFRTNRQPSVAKAPKPPSPSASSQQKAKKSSSGKKTSVKK